MTRSGLVTAGAPGIGREVARALLAGARVFRVALAVLPTSDLGRSIFGRLLPIDHAGRRAS